jgi:Holliday junction DNA helicase RuvB
MVTKKSNPYKDIVSWANAFKPIEFVRPYPMYTYRDEEDEGRKEEEDVEKEQPPNPLEPRTFIEFVGQEQAKVVLKIIIDAANKEKRLIPNILLTGTYGHGKTTLAKLVAKRHKKKVQIIDGTIAGMVVKPSVDKIYIIDEAHNIPPAITDSFNILIDAGQLCIIACTTNPGALPAPFRSRFRFIYLEDYQPKDIAKILERASKRLALPVESPAINEIANRSKCNPRSALTILEFVREIRVVDKTLEVTPAIVLEALTKLNIDSMGLTNMDRKYLGALKATQPVGLQYLSSILSIDGETIQEEIEPYLLRLGLIERTPRGRIKVDPDNSTIGIDIPKDLLDQLSRSMGSI